MSHTGNLPTALRVGNNEPWIDAIEFVDGAGDPISIVGPVKIGLRLKWDQEGYTFLFTDSEVFVEGHTASWNVPLERMQALAGDAYLFEVVVGEDDDRQVRIRGNVQIIEGIVP